MAFSASVDDPFITLRYAANVVHGLGAVFNQGQHVQGFTSPLHLCVAIVLYLLPGGHDLFKLKLSSVVFGFLAIREAGRLMESLPVPRWALRLGFVAIGASWIVAFASVNGLETTLEMWLLIALTRRLIVDGPRRSPILLGVLAFAAVAARPDALLTSAALAFAGSAIERYRPLWLRVSWLTGTLLAAVSLLAIGLIYYGDALPNTYYAKDMALKTAVPAGARYLINSLQPGFSGHPLPVELISWLLLIAQLVFLELGIYAIVKHHARFSYLIAILVAQVVFVLKSGGDWMQGGRFIASAVIPLVIIELIGLVSIVSYLKRTGLRSNRAAIAVTSVALLAASIGPLLVSHSPAWDLRGLDDRSILAAGDNAAFAQIWLSLPADVRCLRPGQLIATSEVAYLGFVRQDLQILDLRGLVSRDIAKRSPAALKSQFGVGDKNMFLPTSPAGSIILSARPAMIVTFDALVQQSVLDGKYQLVKEVKLSNQSIGIYVPTGDEQCEA